MSGLVGITGTDSSTGLPVDIAATANAAHVHLVTELSGEDTIFDAVWGGLRCRAVSLTADGQVGAAGPCYYLGHIVTTALSAAVVNVRDAIAAGSGTIVDIIAASAAAGVKNLPPAAIYCATGCYADFGGTGTVTFFYWQG